MAAIIKNPKIITGPTVILLSGGNLDVNLMARVIERGLNKSGRLCQIELRLADIPGSLEKLVHVFNQENASIVAVEAVKDEDIHKYGVVDVAGQASFEPLRGIVEKPSRHNAPSNLGVVGRYILTPSIFDHLRQNKVGAGGEIQLTDAIAALLKDETAFAYQFSGTRYDCGSKLGFFEATVAFTLANPEIGQEAKALLERLGCL